MKAEWPRITVVTPSFNQAAYLRETIESVVRQNYPNLEYFIVDGGSTDGSVEIIREYEQSLDWWVSEPDKGQSDAIRKGFARATGDLIGWLNSDDVYFPGALAKSADAFRQKPDASLYIGGVAIGSLGDGPIRRCMIPPPLWAWVPSKGQIYVAQQGSFYKRTIYEEIGGIDINKYMRMDGDLFYRLLTYHPKLAVIEGMVGFIRHHGLTKTMSDKGARIYRDERQDFMNQTGLEGWKRAFYPNYFRFLRVISGSFPKSMLFTWRYRNKTMREIWAG